MTRTVTMPIAPIGYRRDEEQVFRDRVRRGIEGSATVENLYLLDKRVSNLPEYADDTAAGAGGLVAGQFYRTATGVVMVKL